MKNCTDDNLIKRSYDFMQEKMPSDLFPKSKMEVSDPNSSINRFLNLIEYQKYKDDKVMFINFITSFNTYAILTSYDISDDFEKFTQFYPISYENVEKNYK